MFAFAIWDCEERSLFCARDRAGEKPFYYTFVNGTFIFGSELKSLLLWPGFRQVISYPALIDFFTFGFVADPKCIWEGSLKLAPAHAMIVRLSEDNTVVSEEPYPYWDMTFDPDYRVSNWDTIILDNLQAASQEMAFADVPVGAFLSGGVDSSSVTAALSRAGCQVNSFTIGFDETSHDERPWARQVAKRYSANHTERVVQPSDISAVLQKMLYHYDEPFNDYSYLPTYYVCREARKSITVALSGDGGDEAFAGYRKYERLAKRAMVERTISRPVARILAHSGQTILPKTSSHWRTLYQYSLPADSMMSDMITTGFSHAMLRHLARGPLAAALKHYSPMDAILPLVGKAPPREVSLINTMRYIDLKFTLPGDILVKVDRASMAVSLEVRPVFLHRDLLTLAGRIPPALLADQHQAKKILKSALQAWLPHPLLYRKKQGFAMPLRKWLNTDLSNDFLLDGQPTSLDDFLDPVELQKTIGIQTSKGIDTTSKIHAIFFLGRWLEYWS